MKLAIATLLCLPLLVGLSAPAGAEAFSNARGEQLAPPARPLPPHRSAQPSGERECDCIDLVFVLDSTGSMGDAINNVKAGLASILALADAQACGDIQAGVLAFFDLVEVRQAMTFDMGLVTSALNGIFAAGGNNWPEASDEAMRELATASACLALGDFLPGDWRSQCCKVAILVTDAPPGGCDDLYAAGVDDAAAHAAALDLAALGVQIGSLYTTTEGVADPVIEAVMLDYATTTNGVYGEIPADGSGTAAAIEDVILNCIGTGATELCCIDDVCTTVLEGQCVPLGGEVVQSCDDCGAVASERASWSTVKSVY